MQIHYRQSFEGLDIHKLEVGTMENNIFLIVDTASSDTYIVDGGYEPQAIADYVASSKLRVRAILVTHGHRDHHENVASLRDLLDSPIAIGADDVPMLGLEPDIVLQDEQVLPFGDRSLRAIHTPGHTPGSTCLVTDGHLFTGDTLFPGGPGNTQRDPVRFAEIMRSLQSRLFVMPDGTTVRPGHGRDTTIGQERPHIDEWIARGW